MNVENNEQSVLTKTLSMIRYYVSYGEYRSFVLPQVPDEVLHRIQNIDRWVKIIDVRGWFDIELRATWPQWTVERYLGARTYPATSLEERNRVLASAQIVLTGSPLPIDLRARTPRLKWVHELPAGASNFLDTDLWGSDVLVTTARGLI